MLTSKEIADSFLKLCEILHIIIMYMHGCRVTVDTNYLSLLRASTVNSDSGISLNDLRSTRHATDNGP